MHLSATFIRECMVSLIYNVAVKGQCVNITPHAHGIVEEKRFS